MSKRIIAYVLFPLGTIIVLFFQCYRGNIVPYPLVIWLIGIAMWISGFLIIRNGPTFKQLKARERLKRLIADLKDNGEKIPVDLSKCEIKENNYTEEQDNYKDIDYVGPRSIALVFDKDSQNKQLEIDQSVLIYKNNYDGIEERFISSIIPRSKDDLRIKVYLQKTTSLYVDKNNRKRYYFDLDFLNPEG